MEFYVEVHTDFKEAIMLGTIFTVPCADAWPRGGTPGGSVSSLHCFFRICSPSPAKHTAWLPLARAGVHAPARARCPGCPAGSSTRTAAWPRPLAFSASPCAASRPLRLDFTPAPFPSAFLSSCDSCDILHRAGCFCLVLPLHVTRTRTFVGLVWALYPGRVSWLLGT